VIIDDLDVFGTRRGPAETESPLIVHANAVLSFAVALQSLKPITWRGTQELERRRRFQLGELAGGHFEDRPEARRLPGLEELACIVALEAPDHPQMI